MSLFWSFMSEAQKSWKSLMEKTYEIIPPTHKLVPCKIFSIALSKAGKICSSEGDPNAFPWGEGLHLATYQRRLIYPQSTVQSQFYCLNLPVQVQIPETSPLLTAGCALHGTGTSSSKNWRQAAQPSVMGWVCHQTSNSCGGSQLHSSHKGGAGE